MTQSEYVELVNKHPDYVACSSLFKEGRYHKPSARTVPISTMGFMRWPVYIVVCKEYKKVEIIYNAVEKGMGI